MFVQLDEFFARDMTTQEKSAVFGTLFFRVSRGKNNLTRSSRTTAKNSQHITLKGNMSPFEMVPLNGTLVFRGVYIQSIMVNYNFSTSMSCISTNTFGQFFFPVSPPGFLRIFRQPNKKKTELNRGGQAKQTNVVAWDSGSKRSL